MNQTKEVSSPNSLLKDQDSQEQRQTQPNTIQTSQFFSVLQTQDVSQGVDPFQDKFQNTNQSEANNLQSLDEIMYLCNLSNKVRSSSITVDKRDIGYQSGKHIQEKDEALQNFSQFPKLNIEGIQTSCSYSCSDKNFDSSNKNQDQDNEQQVDNFFTENKNCKEEFKNSLQQESQQNKQESNETPKSDINSDIQEQSNYQIRNYSTPTFQENRMAKLKNRMNLNIQPQGTKSGEQQQGSSQKEKANFSSPINEIQSDNSSSGNQKEKLNIEELIQENKKHNLILEKKDQMLNQNQDQEEAEELVQNDEFAKIFQSNCPIKSPTLPKPKKKIDQSQHKLNSSIEISIEKKLNSSNSNIKEDQKCDSNLQTSKQAFDTDSQNQVQKSGRFNNSKSNIQEVPQIDILSQVDYHNHDSNQSIQLSFIADIKSVRNPKFNAFRQRLNLSQHEADSEELRKKSSTISVDLLNMQEPISIKDLQKNYSSHTTETPLTNKKHIQINQKKQQYSQSMKSDFQIDETNEEYKEYDNLQSQQLQADNQVSTSLEKTVSRKFQRGQLRIKVNPVKDQEKEEYWDSDDQASGDLNAQVEPIVTKAKQGSNKFEDVYQLINQKPLGEGASGCVYQCKKINSDDETIYAVKVIRKVDEEMSKNIFQTFAIQYRLQHESISRVYEVYFNEDNQTVHYVMDFVPFRTLDSVIKDKKRNLKETEASSIIQKLLKAVMYMEQRGVCHRDLKPENILISEDLQQLKIIDFGISKSFVKSQRVHHIIQYYKQKMYTPTGTPHYKAPELLLGFGYTQLVDMWAVGIIAYQLIAKGKHPFQCDSQTEQDARIMKYQFDQTDERWINSSSNAKNFIKSLLRQNRMPAFEALKHPWIEQRKIEVPADDDNHSSNKQEKKPDNMNSSVPALFLKNQFNHFGISVTNSEQHQRSGFSKGANQDEAYEDSIPLRACNTIQSTNEFEIKAQGNVNAQISSYGIQSQNQKSHFNDQQNSNQGNLLINVQGLNNNVNNQEQITPNLGKKKHNIQGFAKTQDVVHIVFREELKVNREKMVNLLIKANAIIKNLEEEEERLMQPINLKRTHSAEKQSNSPQSPQEIFGKSVLNNSINQGMQAFNIFKNSSIGMNTKKEDSNPSEQNQQNPQGMQQQVNTSGSFDEQARNKIRQNNIFVEQDSQNILSQKAQSSLKSLGKNTSINEGNNSMQINQSMNNAMIYSTSDFSNMKFSSLMSRKTSTVNKKGTIEKRYVRRNSQQQTNSMEKSIIFTKEVIGELQKDPVIQEKFESQQIVLNPALKFMIGQSISTNEQNQDQYQGMSDSIHLKNFNPYQTGIQNKNYFNYYGQNEQFNNNSFQNQQNNFSQNQNNQGKLSIQTSKFDDLIPNKRSDPVIMNEDAKKKQIEKWDIIAQVMDQKSESGDSSDSDDSSGSSNQEDKSEDKTICFDLQDFMLQNTIPNNQFNQNEQIKSNNDSSSSQQQPSKEQLIEAANQEIQNEKNQNQKIGDTSSSSNLGSEESKEQEKKSSSQSSINNSNSKNSSLNQQGGIFSSAPYTNYMNSSKGNKINQTLLSICQLNNSTPQPATILTTSGAAAIKENISSNNSLSSKTENSTTKSKNQQNQDEKQNNQILKYSQNNSTQNPGNSLTCTNCNRAHLSNISCENYEKIDILLVSQLPNIAVSQKINCNNNNNNLNNQQSNQKKQIDTSQIIDDKTSKQKQNLQETSINDSLASNQLGFIPMADSNIGNSINNQSIESFNQSFKKPNLTSMNVSEASSINANLSLSGSANSSNTLRSIYAITNNQPGNSNNGNSDQGSQHYQQANQKDKSNSSKFKYSDQTNSSQFKKQNNLDLDMSESQNFGDNQIQTSTIVNQKYILDSGLNTSNEVTPQKLINGLNDENTQNSQNSQQQQQNVQLFNSGNSENSKESSKGKQSQLEGQNISSQNLCSPNKKNPNNQLDFKDDSSCDKSDYFSYNQQINSSLDNQQKQQDNQKEQSNTYTSKIDQKYKYLTSNYSTITEESEFRSCLSSSIAQSQKIASEFESTNLSIGQHLKQTYARSMTQMIQSNSEKNENSQNNYSGQNNIASSTSTISTHQGNITANFQLKELKQKQDNMNQAGQSLDEFDSNDDLEQHQITETKSQLLESNNSQKKLNSSLFKNQGFSKINSQQIAKSSPYFNNPKAFVSNQLEEVFGQMQSSSSFMRQEEEFDTSATKQTDNSKSPFNSKSYHVLSPNNKQISRLQNSSEIEQITSLFNEQPPILKHRTSSRLLELSVGIPQAIQSKDFSDDHSENKNESIPFKTQFCVQDHKIEVIPESKNDEGEVDNSISYNGDIINEKKTDE